MMALQRLFLVVGVALLVCSPAVLSAPLKDPTCRKCVEAGKGWCEESVRCIDFEKFDEECPTEIHRAYTIEDCPNEPQCDALIPIVMDLGGCGLLRPKTQSWLVMPIIRLAAEWANDEGADISHIQGTHAWTNLDEVDASNWAQLPRFIAITSLVSNHLHRLARARELDTDHGWVFDFEEHITPSDQEIILLGSEAYDPADALFLRIAQCCAIYNYPEVRH